MEEIKVSVIVPAYNSEKYIEKCLLSILNQTYKNFEIICINDGSKDNTREIIQKLKNKYPEKINYIEQENMGVAKTRNKALKIAEGEYICFIDNDDFIEEDYIEKHMQYVKNEKYDIVLSGYKRPNSEGKIVKELKAMEYEWTKYLIMAPWAKIYNKNFLIDNNIEFLDNNIGEDVYFNLQAYLMTDKIKIIDYIGYNWFFNNESVSNSKQKDFNKINVFKLLNCSIEVLNNNNLIEKNIDYLELFYFRYILWFLLFTCKKHSFKEISNEYDKLFKWLKEKFPNYKNNKLIRINSPKGDMKSYQLLYVIFMILHKIGLGKLFIYMYSKK